MASVAAGHLILCNASVDSAYYRLCIGVCMCVYLCVCSCASIELEEFATHAGHIVAATLVVSCCYAENVASFR